MTLRHGGSGDQLCSGVDQSDSGSEVDILPKLKSRALLFLWYFGTVMFETADCFKLPRWL